MFAKADSMRTTLYYQKERIAKRLAAPEIIQISFKTFRHWKGKRWNSTKLRTHGQLKPANLHKSITSTETYIHIEEMLYSASENDNFTVKVADTLEEAVRLMEVGFEYHAEIEGHKLFRKRK